MPRDWSLSAIDRRRPARWLPVAGLLALAAGPAGAATVLEKTIAVDVRPGGSVRVSTGLKLRLETAGDLEDWASYPILLDENRRLASFEAWVVQDDGRREKVGRKRQDRVEYSGDGIADSSHYFHVVEFPGLRAGATLEIAHVVDVEPYFASAQIELLEGDPIDRLEVTVRGVSRWRLDGPAEGLEVTAIDRGVAVRGRDLAAVEPPDLAAGGAASEPVLRYAWGDEVSWQDVGRWYRDLIASLPRRAEPVRRLAAELTAADQTPRQRLEAILAFLRRKVRYVAVEVGIGGYRPSPPAEVLGRKWGDCKDKSLLLVDLLGAAGIEARPALILLAADRRIDPEFPSPSQFNHLIVAVPRGEVEVSEDDPVAGGYLFVDPTQEHGGARWLHPGVQDQDALVITPEGGVLVRTPTLPGHERRILGVDVEVSDTGDARGRAGLRLEGSAAIGFIEQMVNAPPERTTEDALRIFNALLPGARISGASWQEVAGEIPAVRMSVAVEIEGLAAGVERPALFLTGLSAAPEPRMLDDLDSAAAYPAGEARTQWRLDLPAGWCPPRAEESHFENALGSFQQTVGLTPGGRVAVERRTLLAQRWIEPEQLADLKQLALAEYRASRRRIRLRCDE
jgi:Transglutaminase-like superfamily